MFKNYSKHSKKFIVITMVLALLLAMGIGAYAESQDLTVQPASSKVLVNGEEVTFEAYMINGNNYFKLRDLAKAVSGTEKQFDVAWNNEYKVIELISNSPYTEVGGELSAGDNGAKNAVLNTSTINKDGQDIVLEAYTINGSNYFKLRDIARAFNIGVTWDAETKTVVIDTKVGYEEEAVEAAVTPAEETEEVAATQETSDISEDASGFVVSSVNPVGTSEIKVTFEKAIAKEQAGTYSYSILKSDVPGYQIVGEVDLQEGDLEVVIKVNAIFQYEGEHIFFFETENIEDIMEIPFNVTAEFIGEID